MSAEKRCDIYSPGGAHRCHLSLGHRGRCLFEPHGTPPVTEGERTHAFPFREPTEWPRVMLGLVVDEPLDECYYCQRGECVQTTDDHETILHSRKP